MSDESRVEVGAPAPLRARVRSGLRLNFTSLALSQLISFGRSVIFARILAPDDFGLFGMCTLTLTALSALTNPGINAFLIVSKASKDELASQLNTVWTVELARRGALTLLLLAAAYPTARFFGRDSLSALLPFVALVPLVEGLRNVGLFLSHKQVDFRRVVYFEQATNVASAAVTIALALLVRNVWALVLGQVLSSAAGVLLSYLFHPYRPRLEIDRAALASAAAYGKYGFVISVGLYVTTNADNIFVGKMLGAELLGAYVLAYAVASRPVEIVVGVLNSVMLPAFAEIGPGGGARLEAAFARALRVGLAAALLCAVPLALVADEMVVVVFGAKWGAAGPALRLLSVVGFWRALANSVTPFLISQRAPRPEAAAKVFEAALFLLLLYPLVKYAGLSGAALAGLVVYLLAAVSRLLFVRAISRGAFLKALRITGVALLSGAAGVACGAAALTLVGGALARLFAGSAASVIATSATLLLTQPEMRKDIAALRRRVGRGAAIECAQTAAP